MRCRYDQRRPCSQTPGHPCREWHVCLHAIPVSTRTIQPNKVSVRTTSNNQACIAARPRRRGASQIWPRSAACSATRHVAESACSSYAGPLPGSERKKRAGRQQGAALPTEGGRAARTRCAAHGQCSSAPYAAYKSYSRCSCARAAAAIACAQARPGAATQGAPAPRPPYASSSPCRLRRAAAYSAVTAPPPKQRACSGADRDTSRCHSQCTDVRHCESADAVRLTEGRHMAAMSELVVEW